MNIKNKKNENVFRMYFAWKELNSLIKNSYTRGVNLHEAITENLSCIINDYTLHAAEGGSEDAISKDGKKIQIKGTSNFNDDLTSFGPRSEFDILEFLRLNLEELNNEIKNIKIELNNMEFQKENYYIKAPIDGIIEVVKKININDIIGSEVLVNIIPEENIYEVKIYIDEKNIEKINYDSKVNFTLKDNNDKEIYIKGKIKYISSTPQQLNGEIYYYIISNIEIPKNINLKIGKTIETSIIHGKKTILNYLRDYLKK